MSKTSEKSVKAAYFHAYGIVLNIKQLRKASIVVKIVVKIARSMGYALPHILLISFNYITYITLLYR